MSQEQQTILRVLKSRHQSRHKSLQTLNMTYMAENTIPDEVKTMREVEAAKLRAVMQEQQDLIDLIENLFPTPVTIIGVAAKNERTPPRRRAEKKS